MSKRAQLEISSIGSLPLGIVAELFESVPEVAFFVKDHLGRYTAVNQSLLLRAGLKRREDLLGKSVREIFPPDLAECYEQQDLEILRNGRSVHEQLELHWHANRQRGWCLTTKLPLRDSTDKIVGIIGISRDLIGVPESGNLPAGLGEAIEHLKTNFGDAISPSSLAKVAHMTSSRFARMTHRMFGLTPTQLISQTRLQAATELLGKKSPSVAEIAVHCGFTDHSAFTRAFRTATGQTPTAFRAQAAG